MIKVKFFHETVLLTIARFFSCILGFIRDITLTYVFGAGMYFSVYILASHIASFISYAISEAGANRVLIPVLSSIKEKTSFRKMKEVISHISGILTIFLLLVSIVIFIATPIVIKLFAPGFSIDSFNLAVSLLRILSASIFFSTLALFCAATLNVLGSFFIPALISSIQNIILILSSVFFASYFEIPIKVLAWAILLASILQLFLQIPLLKKKKILIVPRFMCDRLTIKKMLKMVKLIIPAFLGVFITQASVTVDLIFASFLKNESISWLYYSSRLMELPLNIFVIAIITVALPSLSRHNAANKEFLFQNTFNRSLCMIFAICVPASAALYYLATPIITTLFMHGKFTINDSLMVTESTKAFSIGIIGFAVLRLSSSVFYSKQNTTTPVIVATISLLINIVLNFLLVFKFGHTGLALATAISGISGGFFLIYLLRKKYFIKINSTLFIFKTLIAAFIMLFVLFKITPNTYIWLHQSWQWKINELSKIVLCGGLVYVVVLSLFCFNKIKVLFLNWWKPA